MRSNEPTDSYMRIFGEEKNFCDVNCILYTKFPYSILLVKRYLKVMLRMMLQVHLNLWLHLLGKELQVSVFFVNFVGGS